MKRITNKIYIVADLIPVDCLYSAETVIGEGGTHMTDMPDRTITNPVTGTRYRVRDRSSRYRPGQVIGGLWRSKPSRDEPREGQ